MDTDDAALTVVEGAEGAALEAAFELRRRVFVEEQRVPLDLERDAHDADAWHAVILAGRRAVATGRVRLLDGDAKVERVAVDGKLRGRGLGQRIMARLEARGRELGAARVKLAAQQSAIPFYERLGYVAWGEPFYDAGILHRWMGRPL